MSCKINLTKASYSNNLLNSKLIYIYLLILKKFYLILINWQKLYFLIVKKRQINSFFHYNKINYLKFFFSFKTYNRLIILGIMILNFLKHLFH